MMAKPKQQKIKHSIQFEGKGRKTPRLPLGQVGQFQVQQGTEVTNFAYQQVDGRPMFRLSDLLTGLGLKKSHAKYLPQTELVEPGVKKGVAYTGVQQAVLLAATGRTLVGATPVGQLILQTATQGWEERFVDQCPHLYPVPDRAAE